MNYIESLKYWRNSLTALAKDIILHNNFGQTDDFTYVRKLDELIKLMTRNLSILRDAEKHDKN